MKIGSAKVFSISDKA